MRWRACCGTTLISAVVLSGQVSVLTWHNDNSRTGQNLQETILTPANVTSSTFGRLGTLSVDGKVDAQPLYVPAVTIPSQGVHNVLYVATENASVYAFDADTFALLRKVSLLGANEVPSDDHGCSQVTPEIGITATPVIDLHAGSSGTIFAVAQSKDANGNYHHRLHALDLPTLTEQLGGPTEIQATSPGSGAENTFKPAVHTERPGLLISNGVVYTSWGSHCDAGSYAGWVLSYSETTLAQVGVLNLIPNGNDGGIWAAGSGPAADANGNLFLLTGNGTFDIALTASGFPSKNDFGNAFVKISTSGALSVTDYFTMLNTVSESGSDTDLGSGGLILLPPMDNGSGTLVPLVVGAGKDTNIYVLSQNNLGKFSPSMDSIYQLMSKALPSGSWSSPAWFNGKLYYGGVSDSLKAFTFTSGLFSLAAHSANTFAFPGTTPSVSANGTSNGIVWAVENQSTAILHAYDANNVATELYNSNQAAGGRDQFGNGNKFIVPTIANGKVYVGTTTGVGVLGLLTGNQTPSIGVTKSHTGNFTQGQSGAIYLVTVNNGTTAATTTGPVTVIEAPPAGLAIAAMSGTGWNCSGNTCTRADPLSPGASFPSITVTVNVAADAPSSVTNQVSVSGGGSTATASDPTTITPASGPVVTLTAVQNAASYAGGQISPGEIVFLSGSGMGPAQLLHYQLNSAGYIATQLGGTEVLFNGIAAPLIYTQSGSVAAVVPYEIAGSATASVVVQYQSQLSTPVTVPIVATAPGVFTKAATGVGEASAINQDGSLNGAANPAKLGTIVSLYATGEGQTSPPGVDGKLATAPLPKPILPVSVTIGGVAVSTLQYAGGAPGAVAGLLQINVAIPTGVTPGSAVPVVIKVGNATSQAGVTIAVTAN